MEHAYLFNLNYTHVHCVQEGPFKSDLLEVNSGMHPLARVLCIRVPVNRRLFLATYIRNRNESKHDERSMLYG